MKVLQKLIESEEGNKDLDKEISKFLGFKKVKPWSSSFDASLELIPKGWDWARDPLGSIYIFNKNSSIEHFSKNDVILHHLITPAITMCFVCLKARVPRSKWEDSSLHGNDFLKFNNPAVAIDPKHGLRIEAGGVWLNDILFPFSTTQTAIIKILYENMPKAVSVERLALGIYLNSETQDRTITVHVSKLRKRIETWGFPYSIYSQWGEGYRLFYTGGEKGMNAVKHKMKTRGLLSYEDILYIRESDKSDTFLAKKFNVKPYSIYCIKNRKTYKFIKG